MSVDALGMGKAASDYIYETQGVYIAPELLKAQLQHETGNFNVGVFLDPQMKVAIIRNMVLMKNLLKIGLTTWLSMLSIGKNMAELIE